MRVHKDPKVGNRSWITAADLSGNARREITRRPTKGDRWNDYSAQWSRDGSRVAFLREGRNGSDLYVANRDGSGLQRVLRLTGLDSGNLSTEAPDYAWSPDGRRLAFGNGPLHVVNRDGTGRRRLVRSSTCKPSWSPDGTSVLYLVDSRGCGERGANRPDPGHQAIYRIDADGSHRRQLATGSFGDAAWSPDGREIAFSDRCRVHHGQDWFCSVYLMKSAGTRTRQLVKSSYGGWVEWAAGGKQVLWPVYPGFKTTSVTTGKTHSVLPASYKEGWPVGISQDGQRIAVLAEDGYTMRNETPPVPPLIVVTIDGQLIQRITVPRGWKSLEAAVYVR